MPHLFGLAVAKYSDRFIALHSFRHILQRSFAPLDTPFQNHATDSATIYLARISSAVHDRHSEFLSQGFI